VKKQSTHILKTCSMLESFSLSPWPNRILGYGNWKKKSRSSKAIADEYDKNWYAYLLREWKRFKKSTHLSCSLGSVMEFYGELDRKMNREVGKAKAIYGTDIKKALLSIQDNFFYGDLDIALHIKDALVDHFLFEMKKKIRFHSIVELGCGNGRDLFRYVSLLSLRECVGGEISPNAVRYGNTIAEENNIPVRFEKFDYYKNGDYAKITEGLDDYVVVTNHSVEQLPKVGDLLYKNLSSLKNKPKAILHFEPIQFYDNTGMDMQCRKYAELNDYNRDSWTTLLRLEKEKKIRILQAEKRMIGISPFNPTSFVAWSFRN